ncbi:MFS transporter [Burkholderia sp. MSh2]|uniref:MFS transporter n=1 Tax=Burkholderia paludis TaxID=1506587 RepID=A0A6J5EX42_9BURK|nr:MFS transporter [Burkholderia sp. MSh2]CAB3770614.1 Inner membrane transport protein YdhP [Burkholderia paludis]VWC39163.1 MFS transporter [Burkholderia paludis]
MDSTTVNSQVREKLASLVNWPLLALAIGTFAIGSTEFGPMGFLPDIARGVGVSIPEAGQIVSAYAIGVTISAPLMTLALVRLRMRSALILAMGLFTLGNLLSALSPNYATLLVARVVTSFNHGAFIGLGSIVAASVAPDGRKARAVAAMFTGLTVANIGGVPVAAWIAQAVDWRSAFAGMAGLGVFAMAALRLALPEGETGKTPNVRQELHVLTQPPVLVTIATSAIGSAAMFTLYTYMAPVLEHQTAASPDFVVLTLVVVGVGFTAGNVIGGRMADRTLVGATRIILLALTLILATMPLLLTSHAGAIAGFLLFGIASFAIVPPMQTRVMQMAAEAPGLASSINAGAFNLGNAFGAGLGGAVVGHGLGYASVPVAGALMAATSLALVLLGWNTLDRTSRNVRGASREQR